MINLKSYAKINLYLHINGQKDNYHILDSLFSYIELYDLISITSISAENHIINTNYELNNKENLIYKVLINFLALYKIKEKFYITHHKSVPMAAGMGGGSSNAACIINFLYDYFSIEVSLSEKINFALKFGADIPFFLTNYSRYVSGIGEILNDKTTYPKIPLLIINPKTQIKTKDVFAAFSKQSFSNKMKIYPTKFKNKKALLEFLANTKNDLTDIALEKDQKLANIYNYINQDKYFIRLTGTGPTCFIIAKDSHDLNILYNDLKAKFVDYLILKSNMLAEI